MADEIVAEGGARLTPEAIAEGFVDIAVGNMANAIKKISVQRGHDVTGYVLATFGGAGGQHACLVADALGMTEVFVHPLAGVLSAYGMGLADQTVLKERAIEVVLGDDRVVELDTAIAELEAIAVGELAAQGVDAQRVATVRRVHLRYEGTDSPLVVGFGDVATMRAGFEALYRKRYSFLMPERELIVEAVSVEAIGRADEADERVVAKPRRDGPLAPVRRVAMYGGGRFHDAALYARDAMRPGDVVDGPAIIAEANATTVVEDGWRAEVTPLDHVVMTRVAARSARRAVGTDVDPVMLEVFNNLFMAIAEQMGVALQNTAYSVNIKERLDFSCALFDADGNLIANAPHMPVHLGSMGESIKTVISAQRGRDEARRRLRAQRPVSRRHAPARHHRHHAGLSTARRRTGRCSTSASRGHHADVGGITPGSMPPGSTHVDEEGVLLDNVKLVAGSRLDGQGRFLEDDLRARLAGARYPARNPDQNIADLRAQIAANQKGVEELRRWSRTSASTSSTAYMGHVQDNAEESVRRVVTALKDGAFDAAARQRRGDPRSRSASTARRARRRSTSPARRRSRRTTSTRRRRSAWRRCCTCSARSSTTTSR